MITIVKYANKIADILQLDTLKEGSTGYNKKYSAFGR
jgi:hypothetical protein